MAIIAKGHTSKVLCFIIELFALVLKMPIIFDIKSLCDTNRYRFKKTGKFDKDRGYLQQMDERERAGILDMMAAQQIRRSGSGVAPSLAYAGNDMNPGREDGRSLFSLTDHCSRSAFGVGTWRDRIFSQ